MSSRIQRSSALVVVIALTVIASAQRRVSEEGGKIIVRNGSESFELGGRGNCTEPVESARLDVIAFKCVESSIVRLMAASAATKWEPIVVLQFPVSFKGEQHRELICYTPTADGKGILVLTDFSATSFVLFRVEIADHSITVIRPTTMFYQIESGADAGAIIVAEKSMRKVGDGLYAMMNTFHLVSPRGEERRDLGDNEVDVDLLLGYHAVFLPRPVGESQSIGDGHLVRVGADVENRYLLNTVDPICSTRAVAEQARGIVRVSLRIGTNGHVEDARAISGPPVLSPSVLQAVKQWRYAPPVVNGKSVEVATDVDVEMFCGQ